MPKCELQQIPRARFSRGLHSIFIQEFYFENVYNMIFKLKSLAELVIEVILAKHGQICENKFYEIYEYFFLV